MSVDYAFEVHQTVLALEDVHVSIGGRPILSGIDARVRNLVRPGMQQGQVVALLGPSGIGKTQLFRVLAGLTTPDRGRVLVGGTQRPVRPGDVGVVMQHYPLFRHRTVRGNLVVAGRQAGLSTEEAEAKAAGLLERFGLADRASAWPAELSGGQRQRVAIAQQLVCSEHLLLLDEPFSGLDPRMKAEACRLVLDVSTVHEENTIVVVTHDVESAVSIADEVWVLGRPPHGEGATIVARVDLKEREIAWRPDRRAQPRFRATVDELLAMFERR